MTGKQKKNAHLSMETTEPMSFGSGFISGILSSILGIFGLGIVLSLKYPNYFTTEELTDFYSSINILRAVIHVILISSFILGCISTILRANKALGLTGIICTLVASLLGGSQVEIGGEIGERSAFGLDYFVLSLILYSAVFIPLERLWSLRPEQAIFRREWNLDLTYFFMNSILVEVLTFFTLQPSFILFEGVRIIYLVDTVGALPLIIQVPILLIIADLAQYWIHRTFHVIPFLWNFHSIHHSAETMDWLAGSRLHLVDAVVTRGFTYIPIFCLGFSEEAIFIYVFLVAIQATFIHANVRWEFETIQNWIATPAFHHWHHGAEPEAIDKNFSVHTPLWDRMFGTYYMPGRWPKKYGLAGDHELPKNWIAQMIYPFKKKK